MENQKSKQQVGLNVKQLNMKMDHLYRAIWSTPRPVGMSIHAWRVLKKQALFLITNRDTAVSEYNHEKLNQYFGHLIS